MVNNSAVGFQKRSRCAAGFYFAAISILTLGGCSDSGAGDDEVADERAALKGPAVILPGDELGPVVVSRTMPTGNTVRLYDLGEHGALVMETGEAGISPTSKPAKSGRRSVLKVWEAIAPGEPIPSAVQALHDRLQSGQPRLTETEARPKGVDADGPLQGERLGGPVTQALDGCSNGCCDYNWLYTEFEQCHGEFDYDWMHFNSYSGYANVNDVWYLDALVCAARGTSRWHLTLGAAMTVDVDVAPAHFLDSFWVAPVSPWPWDQFYDENLRSTVNNGSSKLHTYCGGVFKE